jgi:predicted NUDIX family NTP pyrophosphohydrolase
VPKTSAGVLPFRWRSDSVEVFIVHPAGPYWAHKDAGAWSIAKGEYDPGEDTWQVALREFEEEVGIALPLPDAGVIPLADLKQPSGKIITAWAVPTDFEVDQVSSNSFQMEWPRGSGRLQEFPEVDRAEWFGVEEAKGRLLKGQRPFVDELITLLGSAHTG